MLNRAFHLPLSQTEIDSRAVARSADDLHASRLSWFVDDATA